MVCSIFLMLTIFLSSCKQDVSVTPTAAVEKVENVKIVDLNIQGVEFKEGMLIFTDYEALSKAKVIINEANFESYKAFCEKIGFKSLALLKDELFEKLDKCQTEEEALALKILNQDIADFSNNHVRLKNTSLDLLRMLNCNSTIKIKNALYRFDEKGEILVSNGDVNSMNRAIVDRKGTSNVAVFNENFTTLRTPCGMENNSGWQYASGNSKRRGIVDAKVFYRYYEDSRNSDYYEIVTDFSSAARAEKKSIFGWWYDYQTDNELTITEVKVKVPSPLPASFGILPTYRFFLNRKVSTSNEKGVGFFEEVNRASVLRLQFNEAVRPSFEYVDVSYCNRGGVSIDYRCDN